ncbi:V-set and immunoglobulin domain-containing protein 8b [Osmerus eperlanus]|uniref:V-set and immunoglobulin domain-containing protein 8b n=1 Tax=Osmerus eperlanus TaxID=29151 RepID=UPI002E128EE2
MGMLFTQFWLQLAGMFVFTHYLNSGVTEAMQVTSTGPQTIQKAKGESVTLGCTYTPGSSDTGELDIEWSNVSPDMTQKDTLILSYAGGKTLHYGDASLSSRLSFVADPTKGDASVSISSLLASDTATYQCKVKKAPGVDMRKVTVVVMVPPSEPKCWVDSSEEKGTTVSLRCKSSEGSTPLKYVWKRESGGPIPPTATQDPQTGLLMIKNHSESYMGNYLCEVQNAVGKQQCKYTLNAYNPTDRVGVIVGAVIGALLLLLLLLFLIWLLICCCHKRRYQKELANEIREDAPAPESRPSSRNSSYRSVLGYRAHSGVIFSSARKAPSSRAGSGQGSIHTDQGRGTPQPAPRQNPPPLKYDSRYGYPV